MNTSTVPARTPAVQATPMLRAQRARELATFETAAPTVQQLQRAAEWERDSFEIHWSVCRTRKAERFCQRCEDLDLAAFEAERVTKLEARREHRWNPVPVGDPRGRRCGPADRAVVLRHGRAGDEL